MAKQQGAALIIVLALLSGALMIGLSGMNSALVNERLAGNYRASASAQMVAENGASRLEENDLGASVGNCDELVDDYSSIDEGKWNAIEIPSLGDESSARYLTCEDSRGHELLLVQGRIQQASAVSFIARGFGDGENVPPFLSETDVEGFFDWLMDNFSELSVEENCNKESYARGGVYYCDSDFSGDLDGSLDGVTLIYTGDVNSNVKGDVEELTLITPGKITFKGIGKKDGIKGSVWSGGDVTLNGGGGQTFDINVCANEDATVNGGTLADNKGCDWVEDFVTDNLGFEGGSGISGNTWKQF